jgi:hypothetical protein
LHTFGEAPREKNYIVINGKRRRISQPCKQLYSTFSYSDQVGNTLNTAAYEIQILSTVYGYFSAEPKFSFSKPYVHYYQQTIITQLSLSKRHKKKFKEAMDFY